MMRISILIAAALLAGCVAPQGSYQYNGPGMVYTGLQMAGRAARAYDPPDYYPPPPPRQISCSTTTNMFGTIVTNCN